MDFAGHVLIAFVSPTDEFSCLPYPFFGATTTGGCVGHIFLVEGFPFLHRKGQPLARPRMDNDTVIV